jgi:hypothetical protein
MSTVQMTEAPEPAKRRTGRSRGSKRAAMQNRVALCATPAFQAWLYEFADHLGGVSRSAGPPR